MIHKVNIADCTLDISESGSFVFTHAVYQLKVVFHVKFSSHYPTDETAHHGKHREGNRKVLH